MPPTLLGVGRHEGAATPPGGGASFVLKPVFEVILPLLIL